MKQLIIFILIITSLSLNAQGVKIQPKNCTTPTVDTDIKLLFSVVNDSIRIDSFDNKSGVIIGSPQFIDDVINKPDLVQSAANDLRVSGTTIVRGSDDATNPKGSGFISSIYNHMNGFNDSWVNGSPYYPFLIKPNGELWGWSDGTNTDIGNNKGTFYFNPNGYSKLNIAMNTIANINSLGDGAINFGNSGSAQGLLCKNFGGRGISNGVHSYNFAVDGISSSFHSYNFGQNGIANGTHSFNFGLNSISSGYHSYNFGENGISSGQYAINFMKLGKSIADYSMNFGYGGESNGGGSFNFGENGISNGNFSINFGQNSNITASNAINFSNNTNLSSFSAFQLGYNGVQITGNPISDTGSDVLFKVDNGSGLSNRSTALLLLQNGFMQIHEKASSMTEDEARPVAALEVTSFSRGILVPRMDAATVNNWKLSFNTTTDVTGPAGTGNETHSRQGETIYDLSQSKNIRADWNGITWFFTTW